MESRREENGHLILIIERNILKKKVPPLVKFPDIDDYYEEAKTYVNNYFSDHLGTLTKNPLYPSCFESSKDWLQQFFEYRFFEFGDYEDAILIENSILNHSLLTPMLNVGLIEPKEIIDECLYYAKSHNIPINSTEGFVRQILGGENSYVVYTLLKAMKNGRKTFGSSKENSTIILQWINWNRSNRSYHKKITQNRLL